MVITKKLNLMVRVLLPALIVAAFLTGCFSGVESDSLAGRTVENGRSVSVRQVEAYPASLANTDWVSDEASSQPYYIVLNFSTATIGNVLQNNSNTPVAIPYRYTASTGGGSISGTGWTGDFQIDPSGTTMTLTTAAGPVYTLTLIVPQRTDMTGFVGDTITPRNIYSSIDFEASRTVQTTFGDGTFPAYNLLYYDGVSAGIIDTLGLFYLSTNASGALTVVFPDFYRYHMGQPVIYATSSLVLASLAGTRWISTPSGATVVFTATQAIFSDPTVGAISYVYNNYQAGGAGVVPGTVNDPGSFLVANSGSSSQTLTFFNYKSRANPPVPLVFTRQ
jgi:hypothetical protein